MCVKRMIDMCPKSFKCSNSVPLQPYGGLGCHCNCPARACGERAQLFLDTWCHWWVAPAARVQKQRGGPHAEFFHVDTRWKGSLWFCTYRWVLFSFIHLWTTGSIFSSAGQCSLAVTKNIVLKYNEASAGIFAVFTTKYNEKATRSMEFNTNKHITVLNVKKMLILQKWLK